MSDLEEFGRRAALSRNTIEALLERARRHLRMDVAFVSAVSDQVQEFVYVTGDGPGFGWIPSLEIPASDGYCQYVLSGELPNIVSDARSHFLASRLAATDDARIGAYLGVPLALAGGRVYGALCLASHESADRFGEADVEFLQFVGRLIADELSNLEQWALWRLLRRDDLLSYLASGAMTSRGQTVHELQSCAVRGVEALTSFPGVQGGPLAVFAAAEEAGMLETLELAAIRAAIAAATDLPHRLFLAVNASPSTIVSTDLFAAIAEDVAPRLVVELTEHASFGDQHQLRETMRAQRERGLRFAIDDVGSGFSSLSMVLALQPEFLKLDIDLIRGIDTDPHRQALVRSVVSFAADTGAEVIAEGIETAAERQTLLELDVPLGQGFFLGRPTSLDTLHLSGL